MVGGNAGLGGGFCLAITGGSLANTSRNTEIKVITLYF